ncbi:MAG: tRNA (N(6)-L-threonylcarbamoyladenosine(37)-C(2))-methylthiotransferase MtaB [Deltaproteobacteria bacterium HGW-Deltaproteobacteria-23]|nr:MAG: tRNA (N(6)-L-threonylcarbamoyladenosine(37)-C(2))-methylthiotransferase MtaB [Deltaproteobacteria bacterium HGW-Deltaproteobacteria-23]
MNSEKKKNFKRVAITTLGCKTNQFESAAMSESLAAAGYENVPFTQSADVYIINTCTVTAKSDAESRRLIRRAARLNPASQVVVTGCYAQLAAKELADLPNVSLVIGNSEKRGIAALLEDLAGEVKIQVADIDKETGAEGLHLESFAEHTRAFLQIQNGCNSFCSYCIVPYARGRSRSVPFDDVLAGARKSAAAGFREIVLTGIHLGIYGLDLRPKRSLVELVKEMDAAGFVSRLRIGSLEPNEITAELIELLSRSKNICPHLHLPLQSGSARVIKAMGRNYDPAFIKDVVTKIVAEVADIAIGFDVIAGFPGESEAEHTATVELIESLPISYLHVFPYSSRPGTAAAAMPGHLQPAVVKRRAEELRALGERKKRAFAAGFIGRDLQVLVQGAGRSGIASNYLTVQLDGGSAISGDEVTVRITSVNPDGVCRGFLPPGSRSRGAAISAAAPVPGSAARIPD